MTCPSNRIAVPTICITFALWQASLICNLEERLSVASNSSATIECRNILERRQSGTSQSGLTDFPTSSVPPSMTPTIISSSTHRQHPHHSSYTLPTNHDSKVAQRSASTTPFISSAHSSAYKHHSNHSNVKTRHSHSKFKTQQIEYTMESKGKIKNWTTLKILKDSGISS